MALRGVASSGLDLSDGLASDLGHILRASGVGAQIELDRLPLPQALLAQPDALRWPLALAGGDDYELCFTVPEAQRGVLATALANAGVNISEIGRIVAGAPQIEWLYRGEPVSLVLNGWDHFKEST